MARPITLNVSQQWDQRMRTNWSLSSVHGRLVLWNVINFLPNDRKSIVMKRFGISEDGETIPPTTITDLARQTSTSKQNIDQILARTKTQIDILLSFVRRGGTL